MDKWMYERMTKENSEKSTEELTQEILALEEIECNDRYFANQCEAGNAIANINKLFEALNTMENVPNSVRLIIENTANITKTIHTIQSEPVAKSTNFIYKHLLKFRFS